MKCELGSEQNLVCAVPQCRMESIWCRGCWSELRPGRWHVDHGKLPDAELRTLAKKTLLLLLSLLRAILTLQIPNSSTFVYVVSEVHCALCPAYVYLVRHESDTVLVCSLYMESQECQASLRTVVNLALVFVSASTITCLFYRLESCVDSSG